MPKGVGTPEQRWAANFAHAKAWQDAAPDGCYREENPNERKAERLFWDWVCEHFPKEVAEQMAALVSPVPEGSALRALLAQRERWANPTFIGPF